MDQQSNSLLEELRYAEETLYINPHDVEGIYQKATLLWKLDRFQESLQELEVGLGLEPTNPKLLMREGSVLDSLGRFEEALACYNRALLSDAQLAEVHNNKGNTLKAMTLFPQALQSYDRALELRPEFISAHHNKGLTHADMLQFGLARESLQKVIELDPQNSEGYFNMAILEKTQKNYPEAIRYYDLAIETNPTYAQAYNNKGSVYDCLFQLDKAIDCYDQAIEVNAQYYQAYNNKGLALDKQKHYDEALKCYDEALLIKPNNPISYQYKAITLKNLKRFEEAIECYNNAITNRPNADELFINKGHLLRQMGSLDEALLEYDQAIVVRKESYLGHYFKGLCLYQMQQFNESMVCLDRCLKINPYAPAYVLKGNILKLLFQLNESKYLFRDCLERYPEDILCLSNYGSLLYLMLERDKAFNLLQRAREFIEDTKLAHSQGISRHDYDTVKMQIDCIIQLEQQILDVSNEISRKAQANPLQGRLLKTRFKAFNQQKIKLFLVEKNVDGREMQHLFRVLMADIKQLHSEVSQGPSETVTPLLMRQQSPRSTASILLKEITASVQALSTNDRDYYRGLLWTMLNYFYTFGSEESDEGKYHSLNLFLEKIDMPVQTTQSSSFTIIKRIDSVCCRYFRKMAETEYYKKISIVEKYCNRAKNLGDPLDNVGVAVATAALKITAIRSQDVAERVVQLESKEPPKIDKFSEEIAEIRSDTASDQCKVYEGWASLVALDDTAKLISYLMCNSNKSTDHMLDALLVHIMTDKLSEKFFDSEYGIFYRMEQEEKAKQGGCCTMF